MRSAAKAFERASVESGTGHRIKVTDQPDEVRAAERVVLPGVGAFGDCMRGLQAVPMGATYADALQVQQWMDKLTSSVD